MLLQAALATYAVACSDDAAESAGGIPDDNGSSSLPEAGVGRSDAKAPATTLRFAHLSPDFGPVDFCYRTAKSASFEGPVFTEGLGTPAHDAGLGDAANDDASTDASVDAAADSSTPSGGVSR